MSEKSTTEIKAVGYVRVSTKEQTEGYSMDGQRDALNEFIENKEWDLVGFYEDPGHSGGNLEREGVQELLMDAREKLFQRVIVSNIDRLWRDQADAWPLIKEWLALGVIVVDIRLPAIDSSMPIFKLVFGTLIAQSEYFLADLKEKTKMGMKRAKKEGIHLGRPPAGFEIKEGKVLPNPVGSKVLDLLGLNPRISALQVVRQVPIDAGTPKQSYRVAYAVLMACLRYLDTNEEIR